jgi:serpin B
MGERVTRLGVGILAFAVAVAACGIALVETGEARPGSTATPPPRGMAPAAATAELGLDLLRAQAPGNAVLSPDSVITAVAMAGSGARRKTAAAIAETLHLRRPSAFADVGRLQRAIVNGQVAAAQGDPSPPDFNLANRIFLQQGYPVLPSFTAGQQQHFGAAPQLVDFEKDEAGALQAVNGWVNEQTAGLIPELFESFSPLARLVLVNAVYLKAAWVHPFSSVSPAAFHSASGSDQVDFMHESKDLAYGSGEGYQAVDLPYRASTLSLLIVMPTDKRLGAFQQRFTAKALAGIVRDLTTQRVKLSMPRFHLNAHISLKAALQKLGMGVAFGEAADFSGMTGNLELKIGEVMHAVDIAVDEAGTVAAGATGVEMVKKSKGPRVTRFNVNRPFLFFLRDRKTGAVLFAGRLVDAASAAG